MVSTGKPEGANAFGHPANGKGVKKSGKDNAVDYLRDHPDWVTQIRIAALKSVESELKLIEDTE